MGASEGRWARSFDTVRLERRRQRHEHKPAILTKRSLFPDMPFHWIYALFLDIWTKQREKLHPKTIEGRIADLLLEQHTWVNQWRIGNIAWIKNVIKISTHPVPSKMTRFFFYLSQLIRFITKNKNTFVSILFYFISLTLFILLNTQHEIV